MCFDESADSLLLKALQKGIKPIGVDCMKILSLQQNLHHKNLESRRYIHI